MHERQKHILRKVCLRHTDEVTTEACNYHEHPCFNIIFVSFMYPWKWIESWLSNFPIFFLDLSVCFYFHIRKNGFRSPSLEACTSHTMPMSQHFYRLSIFRLLFPQSGSVSVYMSEHCWGNRWQFFFKIFWWNNSWIQLIWSAMGNKCHENSDLRPQTPETQTLDCF